CLLLAGLEMVRRVWRSVVVGAVWTPLVVESAPATADDASFAHAVEHFRVEHFVAVGSVEAFAGSILPGLARINIGSFRATLSEPFLQRMGDEFRAIVRA